mmetsp:Transcript_33905/g.76234  ORF Transcript_33905/g.76234 Transcript_33905/m.76234 type:complete len:252 (-) Transcript_33905:378-1133(-)
MGGPRFSLPPPDRLPLLLLPPLRLEDGPPPLPPPPPRLALIRLSLTLLISSRQHSGQFDSLTVQPLMSFFFRRRTVGWRRQKPRSSGSKVSMARSALPRVLRDDDDDRTSSPPGREPRPLPPEDLRPRRSFPRPSPSRDEEDESPSEDDDDEPSELDEDDSSSSSCRVRGARAPAAPSRRMFLVTDDMLMTDTSSCSRTLAPPPPPSASPKFPDAGAGGTPSSRPTRCPPSPPPRPSESESRGPSSCSSGF